MAIALHSVIPAAVGLSTAPSRSHAAAPATKTAQNRATTTRSSTPEVTTGFRAALVVPAPSHNVAPLKGRSNPVTPASGSATPAQPAPAAAAAPAASTAVSSSTASPASSAPAAAAANPNAVYTAEQVFGPNPWLASPTGTGPNGITFGYNPLYFATPSTAAQVAQMVGGTVVEDNEFTKNTPGDPFAQQQPNEMVRLPDGALINPGLIASLYTHGLPQWEVDQAISNEVANTEASMQSIGT